MAALKVLVTLARSPKSSETILRKKGMQALFFCFPKRSALVSKILLPVVARYAAVCLNSQDGEK